MGGGGGVWGVGTFLLFLGSIFGLRFWCVFLRLFTNCVEAFFRQNFPKLMAFAGGGFFHFMGEL